MCECGKSSTGGKPCSRCTFLDGDALTGKTPQVVAEMRRIGRAVSLYDLAAATGRSPRSLLRNMYRLLDAGRVYRATRDCAGKDVTFYALRAT